MERFVIVSGLSGAGKTTALQALEEFGFFTVDNLPPQLWERTLELCRAKGLYKLAVVADARTRYFLDGFEFALNTVMVLVKAELVFLEAGDEVLIRRYGLTRRTHPMQAPTLESDLREERQVLERVRSRANVVIDSSHLSARGLIDKLRGLYGNEHAFNLALFSFGFKHGAPRDADLVLDVRGLPNPHWEPTLKPMSGLDQPVRDYVFTAEGTAFYHELKQYLLTSLQMAKQSGRSSYSVGVGCTGGRHRSVAVVEMLARDLASEWPVVVEHRDIDKAEEKAA